MTAVVYHGANFANASTAGVTRPDLTYPGIAFGRNLVDQAAQAVAGISPLEDFIGGGIHPENAVGTAVATDVTRATDSVRGAFGGLKPQPGSTVGPGPAGQAARARSTFAASLRSLFTSGGQGTPTNPPHAGGGQVPAGPNGPLPRDPGLPIGFG